MTKCFDSRITLFDILTFSERCLEYTKDKSLEQFKNDAVAFSATQYLLIILAEAIKRLPAEEERYQLGVHRSLFIELGDGLIQDYDDVDSSKVWNSIQSELPNLREKINAILRDKK
jgi:uncharacterized protein with HEPN domain